MKKSILVKQTKVFLADKILEQAFEMELLKSSTEAAEITVNNQEITIINRDKEIKELQDMLRIEINSKYKHEGEYAVLERGIINIIKKAGQ